MALHKKIFFIYVLLFLALAISFAPNLYANNSKKGPAAEYLENRPKPKFEKQVIAGTVTEILQQDDRLYIQINSGENEMWAVIPSTNGKNEQIKEGDNVTLKAGAVMKEFYSRSLDRNFDQIVFSEGL